MTEGPAERPRLYLFDDDVARSFEPFALTRPVGELLYGAASFRARWERWTGLSCAGHLCGDALTGFEEGGCAPAVSAAAPDRPALHVNSRFVPIHEPGGSGGQAQVGAALESGRAAALVHRGTTVGWLLPAGLASSEDLPADSARIAVEGTWVESVWHLMSTNAGQTSRDLDAWFGTDGADETGPTLPDGVFVLGDGLLSVAPEVEIEPGVVLDTRSGPIRIESGAKIFALTRLSGPSWIGPGTQVFGGTLNAVSLGPVCKVRGEIEETVIVGYSNKAHDGFLGHAVLGRWVNLGAMTTNSDLKNNYGPVRLRLPGGDVDTGLSKVGCFIGDHAKTGIGTMLNTGTLIGAGSNVFGGVMPPTYVPPFHWGSGTEFVPYRLDRFLQVAERVLDRRGMELSAGLRDVLSRAWDRTFENSGG